MPTPAGLCSYCLVRTAIHQDHVVPKSLARKRAGPPWVQETVPSCGPCNWRKGTRRLVPPSWADRVELLNDLYPGTPFRVWHGNTQEAAFREVHHA